MTVTTSDLTRCLDRLKASIEEPNAGLFGPSSHYFRIAREGVVFLAGGAATLLQLAHPFVAHGVAEHSATREDPLGRFLRTFENVYAMIFAPLDRALASARHVHAVHARVTGVLPEAIGPFPAGTRYEGNDEAALAWVLATLFMNSVRAYELVVGPLDARDKDAYYRESARFALLFGLDESQRPSSFPAFERYYDDTIRSGTITVSRPAREIAGYLLTPPHPALALVWRWYTMITASLLPPSVREGYGLRFGSSEQAVARASIHAFRRTYPLLPESVRYVPAYRDALRRIASGQASDARPSDHRRWLLRLFLHLRRATLRRARRSATPSRASGAP